MFFSVLLMRGLREVTTQNTGKFDRYRSSVPVWVFQQSNKIVIWVMGYCYEGLLTQRYFLSTKFLQSTYICVVSSNRLRALGNEEMKVQHTSNHSICYRGKRIRLKVNIWNIQMSRPRSSLSCYWYSQCEITDGTWYWTYIIQLGVINT